MQLVNEETEEKNNYFWRRKALIKDSFTGRTDTLLPTRCRDLWRNILNVRVVNNFTTVPAGPVDWPVSSFELEEWVTKIKGKNKNHNNDHLSRFLLLLQLVRTKQKYSNEISIIHSSTRYSASMLVKIILYHLEPVIEILTAKHSTARFDNYTLEPLWVEFLLRCRASAIIRLKLAGGSGKFHGFTMQELISDRLLIYGHTDTSTLNSAPSTTVAFSIHIAFACLLVHALGHHTRWI